MFKVALVCFALIAVINGQDDAFGRDVQIAKSSRPKLMGRMAVAAAAESPVTVLYAAGVRETGKYSINTFNFLQLIISFSMSTLR